MGFQRCLAGSFAAQRLYKGNRRNPSPRRYLILVGVYNRYVYIGQHEHRGHTVCLRYMIVDQTLSVCRVL